MNNKFSELYRITTELEQKIPVFVNNLQTNLFGEYIRSNNVLKNIYENEKNKPTYSILNSEIGRLKEKMNELLEEKIDKISSGSSMYTGIMSNRTEYMTSDSGYNKSGERPSSTRNALKGMNPANHPDSVDKKTLINWSRNANLKFEREKIKHKNFKKQQFDESKHTYELDW